MLKRNQLVYPLVFLIVLVPVFIVALLTYRPGDDGASCDGAAAVPAGVVPHTHTVGLASTVQDGMQLIFNVSPAAELYQVVDGALELCGGDVTDAAMKHITLDVNDATFALGERLPVSVELEIRRADTGEVVVRAGAPAMYAPGHGYHFGDNFRVPNGAAYEWTATISPVQALRQEGAQDRWVEPVTWSGTFSVEDDGTVVGKTPAPRMLGQFTRSGVHVMFSTEPARTLYRVEDGVSVPVLPEDGSRYFVVDVTDHAVNYEEKLPGATVTVNFANGEQTLTVPFEAALSPTYGYHYGANVAITPGNWTVTVTVSGLDFMRHAGAVTSLALGTVSDTFDVTLE